MYPAKYARCLFKLSQALCRASPAEAEQLRTEAEELYSSIVMTMGTGATEAPTEKDFDALVHISQR